MKQPGLLATAGMQDFDAFCYMARFDDTQGNSRGQNANCGVNPQVSTTNVARTAGWHLFQIAVGSTQIAFSIDGKQLFTVAGSHQFDLVMLALSGRIGGQTRLRSLTTLH